MPSREDEYYAGLKGSKGQPLCPFCGSPNVYPKKEKRLFFFTKVVGWSCDRTTNHSPPDKKIHKDTL